MKILLVIDTYDTNNNGTSIACALFALVGILVNYFSMHRARLYYDILTSALQ